MRFAVAVCVFKTKSNFSLLFLCNNVGEEEAPAAAWNIAAGLGHETWPQGGGKVRPREMASKSEERCLLAYTFFIFDLIPTSHYVLSQDEGALQEHGCGRRSRLTATVICGRDDAASSTGLWPQEDGTQPRRKSWLLSKSRSWSRLW